MPRMSHDGDQNAAVIGRCGSALDHAFDGNASIACRCGDLRQHAGTVRNPEPQIAAPDSRTCIRLGLVGQRCNRHGERIARFVPEDRRLTALDFDASRELLTSGKLDQYRLLHFATHGMLNSRTPELSGLVFSLVDGNGQRQTGVLRLNDIYNLKLSADLVVLSACRTGLGKEVSGEGAVSLARGFMYAGAPRVISSLWAVNDLAASELMERFYQQMLVGSKTPAAALRAAQLALWKEKRWQSPYFWAGFVLQGEPK